MRNRTPILLAVLALAACESTTAPIRPELPCSNVVATPALFRMRYELPSGDTVLGAPLVNRHAVPHRYSDTLYIGFEGGRARLIFTHYDRLCWTLSDSMYTHPPVAHNPVAVVTVP